MTTIHDMLRGSHKACVQRVACAVIVGTLAMAGAYPALSDGLLLHAHGDRGVHAHLISAIEQRSHAWAHGDDGRNHGGSPVSVGDCHAGYSAAQLAMDFEVVLQLPPVLHATAGPVASESLRVGGPLPTWENILNCNGGDPPVNRAPCLWLTRPHRTTCTSVAALLLSNHALLL